MTNTEQPAVKSPATDNRGVPLDRLAGEHTQQAADALRHVLPTEDMRLPVCAFGSSI